MNKEQQELLDEAYENYQIDWLKENPPFSGPYTDKCLTQEEFIDKCKTDTEFSEMWGLKIKERELSLFDKTTLYSTKTGQKDWKERVETTIENLGEEFLNKEFEKHNIPTKLITITYNDKTIESYE